MPDHGQIPGDAAELRRRAEEQLQAHTPADADAPRLLHELQVHQIELEMQNTELLETRNRLELLLEKYTDLYDFAPVGYFTLDGSGKILEINLNGARLLGLERSLVIGRQFGSFVIPAMQAAYSKFLQEIGKGSAKSTCEVAINKPDGTPIWVDLQGNEAAPAKDSRQIYRLIASDITLLKRAEEAQSRVDALNRANQTLQLEIERRKEVELELRASERQKTALLKEARQLQKQLRHLSHAILNSHEEERRRISLELHDEIAQTLVGINVHLSALAKELSVHGDEAVERINNARILVGDSVSRVHEFAMKLRPPVLDDLGLVPALNSYLRDFTRRTQIPVDFSSVPDLEELGTDQSTILYRVAQEALINVAQHAQASEIGLRIKKFSKTVKMEIHDNGKSFDVESELLASKGKRIGVIAMRERIEMIGGRFKIVSAPGKGTTVSVSIPLLKARGKEKKTPTKPL